MKHIVISLNTGEVVADGLLGGQVLEENGLYYFDKNCVNLDLLVLEKKFKPKPLLGEDIVVYSLPDQNGNPTGKIIAWIYEGLPAEVKNLEGKIAMKKATSKEVVVQEFYEE